MINNVLKNFCFITFALVAPITLPAGGIQKSINQNKFPSNTNEIILNSNTSLYSHPGNYAKEIKQKFLRILLIIYLKLPYLSCYYEFQ